MTPYFEITQQDSEGNDIARPVTVTTVTGILLQLPAWFQRSKVEHVAMMARSEPGYPFDLVDWRDKPSQYGYCREWYFARLYYRDDSPKDNAHV